VVDKTSQHRHKGRIALSLLTFILAFGGFFAMAGCTPTETERDLDSEKALIMQALGGSAISLQKEISIEERQDENGKPYLVGVLSDWAEIVLEDLVDAYNADPSAEKKVTFEEVKLNLTEGLVETCKPENRESSTRMFLRWCDSLAELEWTRSWSNPDTGEMVHSEGMLVDNKTITNFKFISNPSAYPHFRLTWQGASGG